MFAPPGFAVNPNLALLAHQGGVPLNMLANPYAQNAAALANLSKLQQQQQQSQQQALASSGGLTGMAGGPLALGGASSLSPNVLSLNGLDQLQLQQLQQLQQQQQQQQQTPTSPQPQQDFNALAQMGLGVREMYAGDMSAYGASGFGMAPAAAWTTAAYAHPGLMGHDVTGHGGSGGGGAGNVDVARSSMSTMAPTGASPHPNRSTPTGTPATATSGFE